MRTRILLFTLIFAVASIAESAGVRLVGNHDVPVSSLSRDEVSRIFMKKTIRWDDGSPIVPVDQSAVSAVRADFTTEIHHKSVSAVVSYWRQQIFSGRNVPPVEAASDAEVISTVRKTPGAIGYVSENASVEGLKVIPMH